MNTVIHEDLAGGDNYSPETVLEQVGGYLDSRIDELYKDADSIVTGYLDAAIHEAGEPRFDPAMSYRPEGFIDEVEVDEINGMFKVHGNGDVNRYWVPYMEEDTMCVFTDHFVPGSTPLEGVRFLFDGNVQTIPEVPGNPEITHDLATVYEAVEKYVADEWEISLLGEKVSPQDSEFDVDISLVKDELLEIQEEDSELYEQSISKVDRIANDPIAQSEKIIEGERIYKINREYRFTGNITGTKEKKVKIRRFGHRTDVYSEGVEH